MENANEVALRDRLNGSIDFILQDGTVELGGNGLLILLRGRKPIGTWIYICPTFYLQPVGVTEPTVHTANTVERAYQLTLDLLGRYRPETANAKALDYSDSQRHDKLPHAHAEGLSKTSISATRPATGVTKHQVQPD